MPRIHVRHYTPKGVSTKSRHAVWVLVADAGRGRLLEAVAGDGELIEIEDLVNTQARLRDPEVASDRAGHVNRGSDGAGASLEPRESPKDHAAEVFAKAWCHRLSAARRSGDVDRVYLLAAPAFLGLLRKNLDRATQRIVAEERAIDFTHRSVKEIRQELPPAL